MRVLHFCPLTAFSGLEQYALDLAARQRQRGLDVAMVVLESSTLKKECEKRDIPAVSVSFDTKSLFKAALQYREIFKANPDLKVLHLHTTKEIERIFATLALAGWQHPSERPKIIQQNHIWISHGKNDPLHWMTHRVLDEIWCSSEPARADLIRHLPVPAGKIKIVRYGRDLKLRDEFLSRELARKELKLPHDALVVGSIARIDPAKGIWELLNGTLKVMSEHPSLYLTVIGGPTPDEKSEEFSRMITRTVENLPEDLKARIRLTGPIPHAARYLKAFDLYAQPSYKETFSLALLDAQLAELPVLGTRSGGTPEVVREGETGWLCEPQDIKSLSSTLTRALNDRENWASYASRAKARIESDFDITHVVNDICQRYGL